MHFTYFPKLWGGVTPLFVAGSLVVACGSSSGAEDSERSDADSGDSDSDSDSDLGDGDSEDGELQNTDPWLDRESGVFVHLFEWPWPDVAEECEAVLGPAGYSAVQVSPPGEHSRIGGRPWWERYQPVSYELESRSGSREEFADMVQRCAAVGVDVYVDAVLNHMSAQDDGIGTAGSTYEKYEFPDYTVSDFHSPVCEILGSDYQNDARRVQECELLGLSDLNTSLPHVQERLAAYLADLVSLGVKGFRIDAAKHMAPSDIVGILTELHTTSGETPYVFLEVIDHGGEAISQADYAHVEMGAEQVVGTTEFRVGSLGHAFHAPVDLGPLATFDATAAGLMESERAVVFIDNHDTQRGEALSYRDGQRHALANMYLLGYPYGYPKVMSSFSFAKPGGEGSSPPHMDGESVGPHDSRSEGCVLPVSQTGEAGFDRESLLTLESGRWVCEHRDPQLLAMLKFRKGTAGAPVAHLWSGGPTSAAYARAGKGFVLIHAGTEPLIERLMTGLSAGTYCNLLTPGDSEESCSPDRQVIVEDSGEAEFSVAPLSAVVLLAGGA